MAGLRSWGDETARRREESLEWSRVCRMSMPLDFRGG
jgi:hypothetical protein